MEAIKVIEEKKSYSGREIYGQPRPRWLHINKPHRPQERQELGAWFHVVKMIYKCRR